MTSFIADSCVVKLFNYDERANRSHVSTCSFSTKNAGKVENFIAKFFKLKDPKDIHLIETLFIKNREYRKFEMKPFDNPRLVYGVRVNGDMEIIFKREPKELRVQESEKIVRMTCKKKELNKVHTVHLSYKDLEATNNHTIAAFLHSNFTDLARENSITDEIQFFEKCDHLDAAISKL